MLGAPRMEFRSFSLSCGSSLQSVQPRLQDQSSQSPALIRPCSCSKPLGSDKSKLSAWNQSLSPCLCPLSWVLAQLLLC